MKIGSTINIGNYENIKIESSEHNHGSDSINLYECNKEIIFILEKICFVIPAVKPYLNKLNEINNSLQK